MDLLVILKPIEEVIQIPAPPQHTAPMPLIDYMILMDAQCTEMDRGLWRVPRFVTSIALDGEYNVTYWVSPTRHPGIDQPYRLLTAL